MQKGRIQIRNFKLAVCDNMGAPRAVINDGAKALGEAVNVLRAVEAHVGTDRIAPMLSDINEMIKQIDGKTSWITK